MTTKKTKLKRFYTDSYVEHIQFKVADIVAACWTTQRKRHTHRINKTKNYPKTRYIKPETSSTFSKWIQIKRPQKAIKRQLVSVAHTNRQKAEKKNNRNVMAKFKRMCH